MAGHVKDRRSGFHVAEGDLPAADLAGAEAVIIHDWSSSLVPVKSVDREARLVSLIAPVGRTAGFLKLDNFEKQARYCLENHAAFLDAPGEWYLDAAAGVVRYRPLPGERLADIHAVAPVAAGLLVVRGDASADRPVRNLHFEGIVANTRIANNEVREMPYTGVSLGWRWDPKPTPCRANAVERNHIHHVMQLLSDGGGIYTLGLQPGSFLRENWIHDIPRNAGRAESNGMFLDQGTMDFTIEKNVIHGLPRAPLRFHMAITNTVRDNVLACVGRAPMIRYNRTKPEDIRKERNLTPKHETPEVASGFRGGAFRFRGGQCFDVLHRPELDPREFTLSAYFKLEAPLSQGRDGRTWLVGKNTHEWTDGHFGLLLRRNGVAGAYLNIGGGKKNMFGAFSKPQAVAIGEWTRLSASYDGRDLVLFVDGREAARTAVNRPRKPGKGHLSIGRRPDGYTYFNGLIDEVELHNVPMAISEVAGPSRVAHWPCDQAPRGKDDLAPHVARIRALAGPRGQ